MQNTCCGLVCLELINFDTQDRARKTGQVFPSATAAIFDQLLPIDGIANASEPLVERSPD